MSKISKPSGNTFNDLMESALRPIVPYVPDTYRQISPKFERSDPWLELAKRFMKGLKAQADALSRGLQENQQVLMFCYHGLEKLQVQTINMPSANVVSMKCLDSEGRQTYVTGHLYAVTFSFVIETIMPPAVRTPIGFNMPKNPKGDEE